MEWDELIGEFRELGGVAENVRLDRGALGRGIFVCDPDKPAALHASENLLFRVADVVLRDGQLRAKGASERRRAANAASFDAYERYFGWEPADSKRVGTCKSNGASCLRTSSHS